MKPDTKEMKGLIKAALKNELDIDDAATKVKSTETVNATVCKLSNVLTLANQAWENGTHNNVLLITNDDQFNTELPGSAPCDVFCRIAPFGKLNTDRITEDGICSPALISFINGILELEWDENEKGKILDDTRAAMETTNWEYNPLSYIPLLIDLVLADNLFELNEMYEQMMLENTLRLNTIFLVKEEEPYLLGAYDVSLCDTSGSKLVNLLKEAYLCLN